MRTDIERATRRHRQTSCFWWSTFLNQIFNSQTQRLRGINNPGFRFQYMDLSPNTGVYYSWFCTVQSWQPDPYGKEGARTKEFHSCLTIILSKSSKLQMSNNVICDFCWVKFLPNILRCCLKKRCQQELLQNEKLGRWHHVSIFSSLLSAPLPHGSGSRPAVTSRSQFSSTNTAVTQSPNSDLLLLTRFSWFNLHQMFFAHSVYWLVPDCSSRDLKDIQIRVWV